MTSKRKHHESHIILNKPFFWRNGETQLLTFAKEIQSRHHLQRYFARRNETIERPDPKLIMIS